MDNCCSVMMVSGRRIMMKTDEYTAESKKKIEEKQWVSYANVGSSPDT